MPGAARYGGSLLPADGGGDAAGSGGSVSAVFGSGRSSPTGGAVLKDRGDDEPRMTAVADPIALRLHPEEARPDEMRIGARRTQSGGRIKLDRF